MIIKVCGSAATQDPMAYRDQGSPHTKYYNRKVTKEKIKEDFGIVLDAEIKKLKINILI